MVWCVRADQKISASSDLFRSMAIPMNARLPMCFHKAYVSPVYLVLVLLLQHHRRALDRNAFIFLRL
jgi:hypothetical protein